MNDRSGNSWNRPIPIIGRFWPINRPINRPIIGQKMMLKIAEIVGIGRTLQITGYSNAIFSFLRTFFKSKAQFLYYHLMFGILGYYLEKCNSSKLTFHFQNFSKTLICENRIQALFFSNWVAKDLPLNNSLDFQKIKIGHFTCKKIIFWNFFWNNFYILLTKP